MKWQSTVISSLLGNFVLGRLITSQELVAVDSYSLPEYLKDLDTEIWNKTGESELTSMNKHIQLAYVDKLLSLVRPMFTFSEKNEARTMNETLCASAAFSQLANTSTRVKELMQTQPKNAGHYQLILSLIENAKYK
jgi:hypothetical protein